jgi:hypothetical protein
MSLTYDIGAKALHERKVDLDHCGVMLVGRDYVPASEDTWPWIAKHHFASAACRPIRVRFDGERFDADDPEPWTLPFGPQPGGAVIYSGETPLFYLDAPEVQVSYTLHFHPQGIAV